jgi:hypothetical protein
MIMPFIEIFLIILCAIVVGVILSIGVIYLIRQIEKPKHSTIKYIIPSAGSAPTPANTNGQSDAPKNGSKGDKLEELLKNHKAESANHKAQLASVTSPSPASMQHPSRGSPAVQQPVTVAVAVNKTTPQPPSTPSREPPTVPSPAATAKTAPAPVSVKHTVPAAAKTAATPARQAERAIPGKKTEPERPKAPVPISNVYKELESNLDIATLPWNGKVTAFQTTAWDTDQAALGPELAVQRSEIAEVYIDIRLANNIVWISNEVGRKSSNLDESYKQLCSKIAERLDKIIAAINGIR